MKKAFHTLLSLGPKSIPATDSSAKGTSGEGKDAKANGTAGFSFMRIKMDLILKVLMD